MSYWKCTKTLTMDDPPNEVAFTEGEVYYGYPSATPGGEWAMSFTDDTGNEHLMREREFHEYFEEVNDSPPQDASKLLSPHLFL